jgi:FtsH-binding integral membrane protein
MNDNPIRSMERAQVSAVGLYMAQVYQWMAAGLLVTAAVAWTAAGSETIMTALFSSSMPTIVLCVLMIGLPIGLQGMLPRLSAGAATLWFLVYSMVMGLALSSIFLVYTGSSIASTFVVTAGMFGAMSLYGTVTKRDLTGLGSFLTMGLIGVILALLVNLFLQSPALNFVISVVGVLVFTGLTAYDTQKLRAFGENAPAGDATVMRRGVILGSLTLYLDFINLFLMLLRFFGDRR